MATVVFEEFRLGVRTRLFNYNLDRALRNLGSRREAAVALGVSIQRLYDWLGFRSFPSEEQRLSVCIRLGVPVDSIFPESIAGIRLERQPEPIALTADEVEARGWLRVQDPERLALQSGLMNDIEAALNTLTDPRGREILRLRNGFEDGREWTLEDCSRHFGVSRERIRQIEARALREMRHPKRSSVLRPYIADAQPRDRLAEESLPGFSLAQLAESLAAPLAAAEWWAEQGLIAIEQIDGRTRVMHPEFEDARKGPRQRSLREDWNQHQTRERDMKDARAAGYSYREWVSRKLA